MSIPGIADAHGRYAVFAIDHRDSLRQFLAPDDPQSLRPEAITALKIELVEAIAPAATGVMLEPEYSIPQVPDAGVLPEGVGFLAALEAQGYLGDPGAAVTSLLDGWSVADVAACGAAGAKLLLPYHPQHRLAGAQVAFARSVVADCRDAGVPILLEPLFFGLGDPADRPKVVLETAATFAAVNPDVLKLPFPVDIGHDPDQDHWFAACRTITELVPQPWAMLSGGGSFADFEAQLRVALDAGCSGFMVGRALWGEAAKAPPGERAGPIALAARRLAHLRSLFPKLRE